MSDSNTSIVVPRYDTSKLEFPGAKRANERNTISVGTWAAYRKEVGITTTTPKDKVKVAQNEFMEHKRKAQAEVKGFGSVLLSSDRFAGKKLQTWTDSKGKMQFVIAGCEAEEAAITPETVKKAVATLSDEELTALLLERQASKKAVDVEATPVGTAAQ